MTIDIRRILVPIDFSEHAEYVIEWASHLALEHASHLILLHVYHLPVEFQQLEGAYLPPDFWANVKKEAEQTPRPLRRRAPREGARRRSRRAGGLSGDRDRRRGRRPSAPT